MTYTPSGLGDGTHTITADYPGTLFGVYLPSSGSVDLPLITAAPADEVSVRFKGAYKFVANGPATTGNIVEGNRMLTGAVTLGAGVSVGVDCTNIRVGLKLATCRITVSAAALGPNPVVTTGLALYKRTVLADGRVHHEIDMAGLRHVRFGSHMVWLPYVLEVSIVDEG